MRNILIIRKYFLLRFKSNINIFYDTHPVEKTSMSILGRHHDDPVNVHVDISGVVDNIDNTGQDSLCQ